MTNQCHVAKHPGSQRRPIDMGPSRVFHEKDHAKDSRRTLWFQEITSLRQAVEPLFLGKCV